VKVPQGWFINQHGCLQQHHNPKHNDTTHYLTLKKNLYCCKQAIHNWFNLLTEGLCNLGFTQSNTDKFLFLHDDCIIIIYVNDCLFFSPSSGTIDAVIASLSKIFKLKDEGNMSAFLGVQITKDSKQKTMSFTQPGLIVQIIKDVGITQHSKGKDTPVDSILHPDPDGPERIETWNYRSIISKLNYLTNNTWTDISMAIHQCACYYKNPKALHEWAIK
jgi:hypothetical protein